MDKFSVKPIVHIVTNYDEAFVTSEDNGKTFIGAFSGKPAPDWCIEAAKSTWKNQATKEEK